MVVVVERSLSIPRLRTHQFEGKGGDRGTMLGRRLVAVYKVEINEAIGI